MLGWPITKLMLLVLLVSALLGVGGCAFTSHSRLFDQASGVILVSDAEFYALDPKTGDCDKLATTINNIARVQFQPQEKTLTIYTKDNKLYVCKSDGSGLTEVGIKPGKERWLFFPSPDITKIAYNKVSFKKVNGMVAYDRSWVYIRDLKTGREELLAEGDSACHFVGWASDSKAVYVYNDGLTDVREVGKQVFRSISDLQIREMSWPDHGNRIAMDAMYGDEPKEPTILTCEPDGTDIEVIASATEVRNPNTMERFYAEFPSISHDGERVALSALSGSDPREWHVFVSLSKGGRGRTMVSPPGLRGVKNGAMTPTRPFWSPDDRGIAFVDGNHFEGFKVFIVDAGRKSAAKSYVVPFKKLPWLNIEEAERRLPLSQHDSSFLEPYIISWQ